MTRILALGLLACLVLVGAGIVIAGHGDDSHASGLPGPRTIVRGGVTYTVAPTSPAGATVGADGREVTVYLRIAESPDSPPCSSLEPEAKVVDESADAVRVTSYAYVGEQTDGEKECAFTQIGSGGPDYRSIQLRLDEPLDGRDLIDTSTGEPIGTLDPTYAPEPAYVPEGYRQELVRHFVPEDDFVAVRQYLDKDLQTSIEVRARSRSAWTRSGTVLGRGTIAGLPATITENEYERCLSWSPRRGLAFEVCDNLAGIDTTTATLARIAQSIPPLD